MTHSLGHASHSSSPKAPNDCHLLALSKDVLRIKEGRLPKIVLFGQPSGATRKAGRPCLGWKDVINKDLKEMGIAWEGVKKEALNRLG